MKQNNISKLLEELDSEGELSSGPCTCPFPCLQNLSESVNFLLLSRAGNVFSRYRSYTYKHSSFAGFPTHGIYLLQILNIKE